MQGSKVLLAIIVLVYRGNVDQHGIIECSSLKLISKFTVIKLFHAVDVRSSVEVMAGYVTLRK
jgi:hypothetical protein